MAESIFSFGTLQLLEVQLALFARAAPLIADSLEGYVVEEIRIVDPDVVALSGLDMHQGLVLTGPAPRRHQGRDAGGDVGGAGGRGP